MVIKYPHDSVETSFINNLILSQMVAKYMGSIFPTFIVFKRVKIGVHKMGVAKYHG